MINKKFGIIFILICLCFCLVPCSAMAASTSDAVEPILPEKECSLTVSYCYGEKAFSNVEVKLYKIADVSSDFKYTLTQPFEVCGLSLDGIQTDGEWKVIRSTLETYIPAYNISPNFTALTNTDGQVNFDALKTGMYLAIAAQVDEGDLQYLFDSALIALPGLDSNGRWQYQAHVNAKGEALPPIDSDEKTELSVLKLWRGDDDRNARPESIEVEIFCNGISYETIILSVENNWAYTWSAKKDGSKWTVIERNVPQGYTMTVEERQSTFVLTNTWNSDDPYDPPQTGDTSNILLHVLLMIGSGGMLIVLGIAGKRLHS